MRPTLLRPEPRFMFSVSRSIGRPLWSSGFTTLTSPRRPGDVGLTLINGMSLSLLREIDFLTRLQADVRLLPVAASARVGPEALRLASYVHHLHALYLDLEQQLDRGLHFGLGRIGGDLEGHLRVLVRDLRSLLGYGRREQHRQQATLIE